MKEVEIQIEERVEFDGLYKVKQSFIFNHRDKNTKYLFDNRYLLSNMFKNLIIKRNIANKKYQFVGEDDLQDRIVLNFIINDEEGSSLNNYSMWHTLADIVPDNCGCEFCIYKKSTESDLDNQLFFFCAKKEKALSSDIKKCINFRQRDLKIIT